MMTTFGPTDEVELEARDNLPEHVKQAEKIAKATKTISGISIQMQIMDQRMSVLLERLDRIEKLYGTILGKFENFEHQRVLELQHRLNGGPTVRD